MKTLFAVLLAVPFLVAEAQGPAIRDVYLDNQGVVRWRDNREEVRLFGANYVITTASDYRAAGYLHGNRKEMIVEDMAQFARMGWDGMRLTFWGDWESADSLGNLIDNDHLDLLDWLIAKARERGIYMLFSPIQLYNAKWPDALQDTTAPGFGRKYSRDEMGTNPAAIAAQVNYLKQILNHVNRYTGVALKDEPGIVFIELVNEPVHHPDDLQGSISYINTLTDAVRSTGCKKLIFYNVSQDFRIGEAIRRSRVQGVTFGWYPTGLVAGHELQGNYLRGTDAFPDMLRPELARMPRIVYEFDSPDLRNATMYPAMARTFRAVGAQFAAMFAYDMLRTASHNMGWQTHYLNLVYTPKKAMSAVIAAEAMRRLPRMHSFGEYPTNLRFGDFRIVPDSDLSELVAKDAFLYAGNTSSMPPSVASLTRIAGYGSSPVVQYGGQGAYFLDKMGPGIWRLEVYPDAVPVRDPFEPPSADKIVTRLLEPSWLMTVRLPELTDTFNIETLIPARQMRQRARNGSFAISAGVYLLSASGPVDRSTLPSRVGGVGISEFHVPPPDTTPPTAVSLAGPEYLAGHNAVIRARVVGAAPTDSVKLFLRRAAGDWYHGYSMKPVGNYEYAATVPAADLQAGPHEFVVTLYRGASPVTFPEGISRQPWDWNYYGSKAWTLNVVDARAPVALFSPGEDSRRLAFSRIGDAGRSGLFRLTASSTTGKPVFHFERPARGGSVEGNDYTASLVIQDRIRARGETIGTAKSLRLRLRGVGPSQELHLTLMEDDGTSWTVPITVDSAWSERWVPLDSLKSGRGVLLPQGFPGEWNYWVGPATGRGGPDDHLRLDHLERIQLSLRGRGEVAGGYGVEIEWANLEF